MNETPRLRRRALSRLSCLAAWLFLPLAGTATAHDFKLGPLRIDHPYATPTPAGARTGAAYLVGATTPAARSVEIHRSVVDAQQVMRMRAVEGIDVPPRAEMKLRHGGDYHLMLIELKAPLKDGDSFPMTLRFEKAGEREVTVWVQTPRSAAAQDTRHDHSH
jgi:copper(I)-binding protein